MKLSDLMKKNTKVYEYIIRTVVPISDETIDQLASVYRRFHLTEIEGPEETIFQDQPLDFYEVGPSKVWTIKIKTQLPASLAALKELTRNALNTLDKMVVVRSAIGIDQLTVNQDEKMKELNDKDLVLEPLTASDYDYQVQGILPNTPKYLEQLFLKHQEERLETPEKIELPNKLFVFLRMPDESIQVPDIKSEETIGITNVGNVKDDFRVKKTYFDPMTGKRKDLGE